GRCRALFLNSVLFYAIVSQNALSAVAFAFFGSADVPGVNDPLSPDVLNDAACCSAVLIAPWFVPQSADSQAANEPLLGVAPKADAFNSAAISCWRSCIRS